TLLLSGKTDAALRAQAERLRAHLEAHQDLELVDVAYSLATTRSHFERRAVVVAHDHRAALDALGMLVNGTADSAVVRGDGKAGGRLALLFTGQGSQQAGMGRALYDTFPVFREALDAVCTRLDGEGSEKEQSRRTSDHSRPLREVLFSAE